MMMSAMAALRRLVVRSVVRGVPYGSPGLYRVRYSFIRVRLSPQWDLPYLCKSLLS